MDVAESFDRSTVNGDGGSLRESEQDFLWKLPLLPWNLPWKQVLRKNMTTFVEAGEACTRVTPVKQE